MKSTRSRAADTSRGERPDDNFQLRLNFKAFFMSVWKQHQPRGSKHPIFKDSGPKTIKGMVLGTRVLKYWGTWTLRVSSCAEASTAVEISVKPKRPRIHILQYKACVIVWCLIVWYILVCYSIVQYSMV